MSATRVTLRSGDLFLHGKYRLEKKLGEGGMGQVWAAIELNSHNLVALKVLHEQSPNFALRFAQECRFYAKLRHPNIVPMYESGKDENGVLYIVMDLLVGKTLRRIIQVTPRLDALPAAHIGIQLADAGGYMHAKGVWHRDLKPENLMIGTQGSQKGHCWVVDLGIAKFARPEDHGVNTDDLPDVGTVRYMAPEQCDLARRSEVDGRADIYAFGGIMYEALTGHHQFIREHEPATAIQIMHGHLTAKIKPVQAYAPACPDEIADLVERCLAKDPGARPQTFEAVGDTLSAALRNASSLPAEHYVVRRITERRREASRAKAFARVPAGPADSEDRESEPPAGPVLDAHGRPTVAGAYPALEEERVLGERPTYTPDVDSDARAASFFADETSQEAQGVDEAGGRLARLTEAMPPSFVPASAVLPFQPPPPTPPSPPLAPRHGKGYTMRMPTAAALLAQGAPYVTDNPTHAARVRAFMADMPAVGTRPATPDTPISTVRGRTSEPVGGSQLPRPLTRAILVGGLCALIFSGLLVALRQRSRFTASPLEAPSPPAGATALPAVTPEPAASGEAPARPEPAPPTTESPVAPGTSASALPSATVKPAAKPLPKPAAARPASSGRPPLVFLVEPGEGY